LPDRNDEPGERMFAYAMIGCNDLEKAAAFYDAVLPPLGILRCKGYDDSIGYTPGGVEQLAGVWLQRPFDGLAAKPGNGTMLALKAMSREQVDTFYAAALDAGGTDEGAPGLRTQYAPDFYACYVRDLDGNKIACVCRDHYKIA
jgi:catechol 2,3-dioxygenase-like lactoylglutathione lyase family enzyme